MASTSAPGESAAEQSVPKRQNYDVVVVGGGAAGLSGAATLARARRSVLLIDAGEPRNAPAAHVHNYLGRENSSPAALYADGRDTVAGYGGEVRNASVVSARRDDDGTFTVRLDDGTEAHARRLLIATGLVDELPDIEGARERFGIDVLHCPYCHGWEVRDQPIGVIATAIGPAMHQALLWRQWSDDVTLFLHTADEPNGEQQAQLAARDIRIVPGTVAALETDADGVSGVRLESGEVVPRRAVAVMTRMHARATFLTDLGLEAAEQRFGDVVMGSSIPTDALGVTAVPGVWAAGNVTSISAQVIVAAAAGMSAGAQINADLVTEDTRLAVEAASATV
jgi:thioredoxin reductase (NADPH)